METSGSVSLDVNQSVSECPFIQQPPDNQIQVDSQDPTVAISCEFAIDNGITSDHKTCDGPSKQTVVEKPNDVDCLIAADMQENENTPSTNFGTDISSDHSQTCLSQDSCCAAAQLNDVSLAEPSAVAEVTKCLAVAAAGDSTFTDAEAVSGAATRQEALIAEIDEKLASMNCSQLTDLSQYKELKQLCHQLQVSRMNVNKLRGVTTMYCW